MTNSTIGSVTNGSKRIMPVLKPKIPNTIILYESDGMFHCDISINHYEDVVYTYNYGALRHTKEEIEEYCNKQLVVNATKGIILNVIYKK